MRREAHPAATQFRVTSHYIRLAAAMPNRPNFRLLSFVAGCVLSIRRPTLALHRRWPGDRDGVL